MAERKRAFGVGKEYLNTVATDTSPPDVPEGYSFSNAEMLRWEQYSSLKLRADWRLSELLVLSDIIVLDSQINEVQLSLDLEGFVVDGKPNPLISVLSQFRTAKHRLLRSLGFFSYSAEESRERKSDKDLAVKAQTLGDGVDSLDDDLIPT